MKEKEKEKKNKHIKCFSQCLIINPKIPKTIIPKKNMNKNDMNKNNNNTINSYQNNYPNFLNKKIFIKKTKEIPEPNSKPNFGKKYVDLFLKNKNKKNNILIENFSQEEKIMNNSVNINNINLINSMNNITVFESASHNKSKSKNKNITVNKKINLKTKNPFKELNYKSFGINFAVKELKQNIININKLSIKRTFPYNTKISPNSTSNIFNIMQKGTKIGYNSFTPKNTDFNFNLNINKCKSEEKNLKKNKNDSTKKINKKIKYNILSPKLKKYNPDFEILSPNTTRANNKLKINEINNIDDINNSFEKIEVHKKSFMKNNYKKGIININTSNETRNNNFNSFFKDYHQKSWTDSAEKIKSYSNIYNINNYHKEKEKINIKSVKRQKAKDISSKIIYNKKQLSTYSKKELSNDEKYINSNLEELSSSKDTNYELNTYIKKPSLSNIYKKPDMSCINNSFASFGKDNSINKNKTQKMNNKVINTNNFTRKYYNYFIKTKKNNTINSSFYITKKRIFIISKIKKIPNKSIYYITKMRKRNIKKIPQINICYFRKELNVNKKKIIFSLKKAEKGLKLLEKIANKRNSFFSLLNKNNDIKNDLRENLNIITINNYDLILNKISDLILANKNITTIIKNQNDFIDIIINKAFKEKIFLKLYSKLCKDLFISLMTKIDNKNNDIDLFDELTKEKSLKNLLKEKIIQKLEIINKEIKYLFYFICDLLENKIFSIKTGFDILDLLFKKYNAIINDVFLTGIELLLSKMKKIIYEKNKIEHIQRYNKYIKIYLLNIFKKREKKNDLPKYIYYRLYNILQNNNNNNIDKAYFNSKMEMIKTDLNEIINLNNEKSGKNLIFAKLNKKYEKELNADKNIELWEFFYYYVEASIDLIDSDNKIKLANEYLNNIINNIISSMPDEIFEILHYKLISLFLDINKICVDNMYMYQIMGYLLYTLINNKLFYIKDLNNFLDKENYVIINIAKVVKYTIIFSEKNAKKFHNDFKQTKLFFGSNIFYNLVTLPLKKQNYNI